MHWSAQGKKARVPGISSTSALGLVRVWRVTNWWDVSAAWASAAGSFAAVAVALYIATRGWRDAAAREVRAQAQLVHCHTYWGGVTDRPLPGVGPMFLVRNDSDQPIYKVRIQDHEGTIAMIPAEGERRVSMAQAEAKKFGFQTSAYDGPYPVAIFFSDAATLRWHRDRDGSLYQVRVPSREGKLRSGWARMKGRFEAW